MGRSAISTAALALLACGALLAQTTINGGRTITGVWDAGAASATRPAKAGVELPATCSVGEQYFKTDAAAGQNLHFCTASNTWSQVGSGSAGAPTTAKYIVQTPNGSLPAAQALSALGTGVLKNTTGTGTVSVASGADLPVMTGDSGAGGAAGAVPAPGAGDAAAGKFLKANGAWANPPGSQVSSVFGRTAAVVAVAGDYDVAKITGLQGALDGKAAASDLSAHTGRTDNPHAVTAGQVGKDTAQWNADRMQGRAMAATAPTEAQVMRYNAGASQWEPARATSVVCAAAGTSHTGDTVEVSLGSCTIAAGKLGVGKIIRITAPGAHTGTYGNWSFYIKLGAAAISPSGAWSSAAAALTLWSHSYLLTTNGAQDSQVFYWYTGGSNNAAYTPSVNTGADVTVDVRGSVVDSRDTVALRWYVVEVL